MRLNLVRSALVASAFLVAANAAHAEKKWWSARPRSRTPKSWKW